MTNTKNFFKQTSARSCLENKTSNTRSFMTKKLTPKNTLLQQRKNHATILRNDIMHRERHFQKTDFIIDTLRTETTKSMLNLNLEQYHKERIGDVFNEDKYWEEKTNSLKNNYRQPVDPTEDDKKKPVEKIVGTKKSARGWFKEDQKKVKPSTVDDVIQNRKDRMNARDMKLLGILFQKMIFVIKIFWNENQMITKIKNNLYILLFDNVLI